MINQNTINDINKALSYKQEWRMMERLGELRSHHKHNGTCKLCDGDDVGLCGEALVAEWQRRGAEFDALIPDSVKEGHTYFIKVIGHTYTCEPEAAAFGAKYLGR